MEYEWFFFGLKCKVKWKKVQFGVNKFEKKKSEKQYQAFCCEVLIIKKTCIGIDINYRHTEDCLKWDNSQKPYAKEKKLFQLKLNNVNS